MRHGQTSRSWTRVFCALTVIAVVSACADSAVAPSEALVASRAPAAFSRPVEVVTFRVDRGAASQRIGKHVIDIPAGAVCDPAVSTYGPTEWDKPCQIARHPIIVTATVLEDRDGNPYVEFQPALRFSPTKEVTLALRSPKSADIEGQVIKYCNDAGLCIDESLTDRSLVTRRVGNSAHLTRRIKHFSGYMISSGLVGRIEIQIAARKSGYMVASGLNSPGRNNQPEDDR